MRPLANFEDKKKNNYYQIKICIYLLLHLQGIFKTNIIIMQTCTLQSFFEV
jgi:hypothetical protein